MIRKAVTALLLLSLVPASALPSSINSRIDAQRRKTEAIHAQLHEKRTELHTATVRVGNLQTALDATNAAISQVNSHLDDLAAQERSTQRKLWWNTIQLERRAQDAQIARRPAQASSGRHLRAR